MKYNKETEYITMFKEVAHIKAKNIKFGQDGLQFTKKINDNKTTSIFFTIKLSSKLINQKTENARLSVIAELISMTNDRIIAINYDENITKTNLYTIEVVIRNEKYEENVQLYLRMFLNHKKIVDTLFDFHLIDEKFKIENEEVVNDKGDDKGEDVKRVISSISSVIENLKKQD